MGAIKCIYCIVRCVGMQRYRVFGESHFNGKSFASDRLNNKVSLISCPGWRRGRWRCFRFRCFPLSTVICHKQGPLIIIRLLLLFNALPMENAWNSLLLTKIQAKWEKETWTWALRNNTKKLGSRDKYNNNIIGFMALMMCAISIPYLRHFRAVEVESSKQAKDLFGTAGENKTKCWIHRSAALQRHKGKHELCLHV